MSFGAVIDLFKGTQLTWLQATGTGVAFIVAAQVSPIFGRINDRHKINKEFSTMEKRADRKYEAAKEKKRAKLKKKAAGTK